MSRDARRAAVLGSPVAHSLSPVLHGAAYAALGLSTWQYTRYECREDQLATFLEGLGPEWVGVSLTMPLKRAALAVADEASELATAIGAANTLLFDGGRRAENTDAPGIVDALREAGLTSADRPLVLGAGGTAQAALAALASLESGPVTMVVRDPDRAVAALATAERVGVTASVRHLAELPGLLAHADLVISTVPRNANAALAESGLADTVFPADATFFDVLYEPWPTPLAAAATASGASVVSGLELLLHQAAHQVTLMTGRPAPLAAMRSAVAARP